MTHAGCVGEDNTDYVTYSGTWSGGATQVLPDPTDYASLSGSATVTGIKWTVNSKTLRGVLTATITLTRVTPAAKTVVYSGGLILVTQGNPAGTAVVPGRGWINAAITLPDEGAAAEDRLIAITEFKINPGGAGANAQFGDAAGSLGIADYSTVTNVAPIAADGTC